MLIAAFVFYRLEGNPWTWVAFRDRMRLQKPTTKDWLWTIALVVFTIFIGGFWAPVAELFSGNSLLHSASEFVTVMSGLRDGTFGGMNMAGALGHLRDDGGLPHRAQHRRRGAVVARDHPAEAGAGVRKVGVAGERTAVGPLPLLLSQQRRVGGGLHHVDRAARLRRPTDAEHVAGHHFTPGREFGALDVLYKSITAETRPDASA
jgi:hypothetical protein